MWLKLAITLSILGLLLSSGLWGLSYFRDLRYDHHGFSSTGQPESTSLYCQAGVIGLMRTSGARTAGDTATNVVALRGPEIPLWIPTILFFIAAAWSLTAAHHRNRSRVFGDCRHCGERLAIEHHFCPKCGAQTGE